ncbi:MAG: TetR/AcrR family transcriptional regulator [Candidatus Pseudobacter hemicellulosilyticus]|uniref:TetR/AcrR family transcriptional regulator n=1 Tax=Candidatus Pseudobacter hemicellulosilyticus TaxID=3121375 RepID=A0AAJ6BHR4_9BACT|nr:MAG: TetR/AcrR family transcriptional regulator [Pseudobacter sp.]
MKPKDETKIEEIYTATLALVGEYGLSGITMSQIAAKAGFATGTVYTYFANKEELIVKLFEKCMANYTDEYFAGFTPTDPFKIAFHTIWMNMFNYSIEKFEEFIFIEQCFHSPFISEELRKKSKEKLQPWKDLIERGKREKLVKPIDSVWLMIYIRGSIRGMVKHCAYLQIAVSDEFKETMFNMCWDAIRD